MRATPRVIIIGAGLAGLSCAIRLEEVGIPVLVLEASSTVGGRVQTDRFEDFRLDRGFQVLFTAYPEAQRLLDYKALKLRPFHAGALVRLNDNFYRISDLFRHPFDVFTAAFTPIGTLTDKLRLAKYRQRLLANSEVDLYTSPEMTTLEYLQNQGFSASFIDSFFRPFLGGIMLDVTLSQPSRMCKFILRMLFSGDTVLPEAGMGAITQQLSKKLSQGVIRNNARVESIQDGIVNLPHRETLSAEAIVVACDGSEAARLLEELKAPPQKGVMCLYYAADEPPLDDAILILNGERRGIVNNMAVLSNISPSYAPEGQALISVSVLGLYDEEELVFEARVRSQLEDWFPEDVGRWRYLKTYKIRNAQPGQSNGVLANVEKSVKIRRGIFVCGDHTETASIQGALNSGRRAAEAVISEMPNVIEPVS